MNVSPITQAGSSYQHPTAAQSAPPSRRILLALYAALAGQLAAWSVLAAHVGLSGAFTGSHQGVGAQVAIGSTIWLAQFIVLVAAVTIKRARVRGH